MPLSILPDTGSAELLQELLILQRIPHVIRAGKTHPLAIPAHALGVEHVHIHFLQDQHILSLDGGVAVHSVEFFAGAFVIALAVAAVAVERVSLHIYRLIGAIGAGNIDDDNMIPIDRLNGHIPAGQDIYAGLVRVVDKIPKLLDELVGIGQIDGVKSLVLKLLHAEQNDAAQGIGKGGIRLPNAVGKTAQRLFRLDAVVLPVLFQVVQVDHFIVSFSGTNSMMSSMVQFSVEQILPKTSVETSFPLESFPSA